MFEAFFEAVATLVFAIFAPIFQLLAELIAVVLGGLVLVIGELLALIFATAFIGQHETGLKIIVYSLTFLIGMFLLAGFISGVAVTPLLPWLEPALIWPVMLIAMLCMILLVLVPEAISRNIHARTEQSSQTREKPPLILSILVVIILIIGTIAIVSPKGGQTQPQDLKALLRADALAKCPSGQFEARGKMRRALDWIKDDFPPCAAVQEVVIVTPKPELEPEPDPVIEAEAQKPVCPEPESGKEPGAIGKSWNWTKSLFSKC